MKAATGPLHGTAEMNQPKCTREHFAIISLTHYVISIMVEKSKFTFSYDSGDVSEPFDHCFTFKYHIGEQVISATRKAKK